MKKRPRLRRARLVLTAVQRKAFARAPWQNKAKGTMPTEICDRELNSSRRNKSKAASWFQPADGFDDFSPGFSDAM
jgi:hypothetical protein